jgi:prevent-host-death family protein
MEISVRQAKARFEEAAAAAARGERVVVTKHGRPFVELVSARINAGMDFERAALVRHELGLDGIKLTLPPHYPLRRAGGDDTGHRQRGDGASFQEVS